MKNSKKILIAVAAIFLLAAGCGKSVNQQVGVSDNQQIQTQTQQPPSQNQTTDARPWFTQTVEGSKFNQPKTQFTEGQTAMDVLEATHQVETKEYSGLGKMVLDIDGIKPDSKHFWEFFVNGKSSNVGASSYILKAGDKVGWKLSVLK